MNKISHNTFITSFFYDVLFMSHLSDNDTCLWDTRRRPNTCGNETDYELEMWSRHTQTEK